MSSSMKARREKGGPILARRDFLAEVGHRNADEVRAKVELAHRIKRAIKASGRTQIQVRELTGIPQSNISKIVTGRVSGFSFYKLATILADLDGAVTIKFRKRTGARRPAAVRVVSGARATA
jgi:predicted XRE-type DNA-binding protein